jgi:hypothetical protein
VARDKDHVLLIDRVEKVDNEDIFGVEDESRFLRWDY